MNGDISRDHWKVPVPGLTHTDPEGIAQVVACRDGSAILHLTRAHTQISARLDVSRAAQLATGIWEAAGFAQQLTAHPGDNQPPRAPTGSGEPASSLVSEPPPRRAFSSRAPRHRPRGIGGGPASVNEGATMDAEHARTLGQQLRRLRKNRGKSLQVIAGLTGIMSSSTLHRIEHAQRPVTLTEIVALANALEIAPSELTTLPVPAPANGHTDSTVEAVRLALDAIDADCLDGLVLPVAVLRDQVAQIHAQRRACQFTEVATELPGLIRNLHTTLATGTDHTELLELAVYLHVHVTRLWLVHSAAPTDLIRRTVFLAQRLAQQHDEVTTLAVATFGVADVLLAGGAFQLGRATIDSITLPPTTAETAGLVAVVTASYALAAALDRRPGDAGEPMNAAAELAERFGATGEADAQGIVFGPVDAGTARMWLALEAGEPDQAVSIAQDMHPERHPLPVSRAAYWVHYGRALAQVRGRQDDAVRALRTAESIFPTLVRRHPMAREVIATLLLGTHRDATGTELRRMAHRAGLPT